MNIFFILVILNVNLYAKTWTFDKAEKTPELLETKHTVPTIPKQKIIKSRLQNQSVLSGNLPDYAVYKGELGWGEIKEPLSLQRSNTYYIVNNVKAGDQYKLELDNIIYAVEGKEIQVSGTVISGKLMGYSVVGHTVLEPYSKKLLINFTTLVDQDGSEFDVKAYALRNGDQFFTPTKYYSKKSKYLLGRVLSAFGAALLESKVSVNNTLLGQVQRNTFKNSGYSAGRDGMEVISNDFKDALNNSKDVAFIAEKMMYKIKFLNSPKLK